MIMIINDNDNEIKDDLNCDRSMFVFPLKQQLWTPAMAQKSTQNTNFTAIDRATGQTGADLINWRTGVLGKRLKLGVELCIFGGAAGGLIWAWVSWLYGWGWMCGGRDSNRISWVCSRL